MLAQVHTSPLSSSVFPRLCHSTPGRQKQVHSLRPPQSSLRRRSREKKSILLGLEVSDHLQWQMWEPGKSLTKHLTLKNVQLRVHKLKYSPPSTSFFNTLFPQPIVLSPGTSISLPVTFQPLEKKEYEDFIRFESSEGQFSVRLHATLPRLGLHLPNSLYLPMCAVQDSSEGFFVMHNMGDLQMCFKWEVPEPFFLNPTSDVLEPGAQMKVKVIFKPQAALVYEVIATCRFGDQDEHEKSIQLMSVAKFAYLKVNVSGDAEDESQQTDLELFFGSVGIGSVAERYIEVHNVSSVNAPFHIEREKPCLSFHSAFSCQVSQMILPAHTSMKIPIYFQPQLVDEESVDYFTIIPIGNISKSVLKATGTCHGPLVLLHSSIVNFGLINLGQQALRTLAMRNDSDVPAYYQFDIDVNESSFYFDRPGGVLAGNTSQLLSITFCPNYTIGYYRRVACLIHHQNPVFLDLIGTCHSDEAKPPVLLPKHLSMYHTHLARGLTVYPPDILATMLKEGTLKMAADGTLFLPPPVCCVEDPLKSDPVVYHSFDPMTEFFDDGFSGDLAVYHPHVTANLKEFNFGQCSGGREAEPLPFTLTNHTKGTVTIFWTCKEESLFYVTPESIEIPPLKSTAFRIRFHPIQRNSLFSAELEAFASYKVLRNYRYVDDATMCPPWCLTVRAYGHTFQPGHQHFVPSYLLDSTKVLFPAVVEGSLSHRSLLLQNTGRLPMTFSLDQSSCPSILVKPSIGYISPGAHRVLLLRTSPVDTSTQTHLLPLQFNCCEDYTKEIFLVARAETPSLHLEDGGQLFFSPTCIGTSSKRSYTLRNTNRLLVHFEWKIQHADRLFLSVSPASGVILPNETLSQTWQFLPREERKYFAKARVFVWEAQEEPNLEKNTRYTIRVIGEGSMGTISAEEKELDLGNILVGGFHSHDLVLFNNGICGLNYALSVEQNITAYCDPDEVLNDPVDLEIEQKTGMIPARTKMILKITAKPARRAQYSWTISYAILTPEAVDPARTISERQILCKAVAQGIYPSFCITDALPECSSGCITRMQLWKLFSLDTLNAYLERDPTPAELTYRVPTRHSTRQYPPIFTPVMLDFNFGAAPVGSDPFVALLLLENKGVVPVDWAFLYPADQHIELEYWAETGEFDPSELHQMRIQDNKLFSVIPKAGRLVPGQQEQVQLTYRHEFVGTDRLPVLLKVSYGREVLLNFIGVTVEHERRYVHFTSKKHQFTPVAIGVSSPPKQIYELYNGGSVPVIYEIQMNHLKDIQESNYHHPVFQCLNPRGEIAPGMTGHVEWIFSPLEARTYMVDIPVHILGGDSALITFQGIGYDQHVLGKTGRFEDFSASGGWASGSSRLSLPGQMTFLSKQRIAFGDIPVYSKSSRLVFLNNISDNESILYGWYAGSRAVSEALEVSPQTGVLQPGESITCVVTLQDHGQSIFYNMDLICEVFVQSEVDSYEQELQRWENEKELQAVEFTITEQDLVAEKNLKLQSRSSMYSAGTSTSSVASPEIRKYKTLPPIKHGVALRQPASHSAEKERMERAARRQWTRPEHPCPFQLHLGVTARSHHIEDYMTHFSTDLPKYFICGKPEDHMEDEHKLPVVLQPETGEVEKDPNMPSKQEVILATDIMAMVIRHLLDDPNFHDEVIQSQEEPVPYFSQLSSKAPTRENVSQGTLSMLVSAGETPTPGEEEEKTDEISEDSQVVEENRAEEEDFEASEHRWSTTVTPETGDEEACEKPSQDQQPQSHKSEPLEKIKRQPAFGILAESILENTLQNIIMEANRGEIVLTARPRVIALPPATPR